jgi:hypothetical protein
MIIAAISVGILHWVAGHVFLSVWQELFFAGVLPNRFMGLLLRLLL